jgi:predicted MPP superfamily phosphohydrolase
MLKEWKTWINLKAIKIKGMTKLVVVISIFFLPIFSFSQNKSLSALEKKYRDNNSFSLILTGDILKFLNNSDLVQNDPELRKFTQKIRVLRVLGVSSKSKKYSPRDIRRLKAEIKRQSFEELMSISSNDGKLKLLVRERNGKPCELTMIADKDAEGFITLSLSEK